MNPEENATTPSMILWFKMQKPTADFIKMLLQFYCKKKKKKKNISSIIYIFYHV